MSPKLFVRAFLKHLPPHVVMICSPASLAYSTVTSRGQEMGLSHLCSISTRHSAWHRLGAWQIYTERMNEQTNECGARSHAGVRGPWRMWDLQKPEVHNLRSLCLQFKSRCSGWRGQLAHSRIILVGGRGHTSWSGTASPPL